MSLARGLDYYTGVIYEAVRVNTAPDDPAVGSIAAGGRYDDLVGIFSPKPTPAVGVSIGVERILAIMERNTPEVRTVETEVFVASIDGFTKERFKLCAELWAAGIKAEMMQVDKPKLDKQLKATLESRIPIMLVIGESEIKSGVVQFKDMTLAVKNERNVPRSEVRTLLYQESLHLFTYLSLFIY